ncbi:hypothetical protein ACIBLB_20500 [Streptosporangium canum]|uniref:hypothetical protein n=1 Tax=Streptosporangium canum TaxID=324952 RepID=UPI0037A71B89
MGGSGADLTRQAADAVVTRDDLATVPAVLALARRARRLVIANLVIAATFIAVLVAWDLFGELPLPLGVAGHEGSTVIVGLNGLRLLRDAAWKRAAAIPGGPRQERRPDPRRSGLRGGAAIRSRNIVTTSARTRSAPCAAGRRSA